MEEICKASAHQSTGLEKTISVFRGNSGLGMTVSALRDGSGVFIRSMVNGGTISKDGRLKVGDGIIAFNGEPTTNLTSTQARAMLRRHSLIGPEISVTYVPAAFFDIHRTIQSKQAAETSQATTIHSKHELKLDQDTVTQSKQEMKLNQDTIILLKQEPKRGCIPELNKVQDGGRVIEKNCRLSEGRRVIEKNCRQGEEEQAEKKRLRYRHDREGQDKQESEARDRIPSLQTKGWRKEVTEDKRQQSKQISWGHPRRVTLIRINGESLGISVFGGRGMGHRLSNGEMRRGIFIKHISECSPASRNNTLTPGDQILQVGGVDVSDFTHEEAVEAIRQAGDKVELVVKSPQVQVSNLLTNSEDESMHHNHLMCEDASSLHLSSSSPLSPIPYKLTGNSLLKKPPLHPPQPPLRLPSGPVSLLTDGGKNVLERLSGPSESTQHCRQGQVSHWGAMLQKYGSLSGELKLVELDCSTHRSGLGVCVSGSRDGRMTVSELQPDGAAAYDGQIIVGDELLEINGQVLYGLSLQNAAAVISSVSSKVKIVLFRTALQHTATGAVLEAEIHTITPPMDKNKELKHDAPVNQEKRMASDQKKPCLSKSHSTNPPVSITSSNHNPLHIPTQSLSQLTPSSHVPPTARNTAVGYTHCLHHKQSYCSSLINPSASEVRSSFYCSACSVRSDPLTCPIIPGCINTIDICKGHSSLGLTIVGGCNTLLGAILIHEVNEGGAAHRDGRLMVGDHILEVNGIDLRMASHEEALSVLRLSPQHVRLSVYRDTSTHPFHSQGIHTHEDMWDLFTVDLHLQPGQELGLRIVAKRNDTGMFVSEISKGEVVESDGRLSLGDQILSVNGEDIRAVTHDYARTLLQNRSGAVVLEVARFRATSHYLYECQNNLSGW